MPPNRRPRDREEKRAEIVSAATTLFAEVGYENASMASIARAAEVTPNTIYWYFGDKDHLLVAVLDEVLSDALRRYAPMASNPLVERILWIVELLENYDRVVNTVHSRTSVSPAINAWHLRFHAMTENMLAAELRVIGTAEVDIEPMTRLTVFAIEALLTHPQDNQTKRRIIELLLR